MLLAEYAKEASSIESQLRSFQVEVSAEGALSQLERDKGEMYREQILMAKDRVKYLQEQVERKTAQGEEIYNALRDYVTDQEERIRLSYEHLTPLKSGLLSDFESQREDLEGDLEMFKSTGSTAASDQSYLTHREIAKCEDERERQSERRDRIRSQLESLAVKLNVHLHVQGVPDITQSSNSHTLAGQSVDLEEAERLCGMLERKDKEVLLRTLKARDDSKKAWLGKFLNGELQQMLATDKYDLTQHINSQTGDLEKLQKLVTHLTQEANTLSQRFSANEDELRALEDEAQNISDERQVYDEAFSKFDGEAQALKDLIAEKREQVRQRDAVIDSLNEDLAMRDTEVERLLGILREKDTELNELGDRMKSALGPMGKADQLEKIYSAIKGDAVDEYLAKYINLMQCQVPIKRLGNGYYLFGTRKIFAKIMNGKLVIRVGGGYMVIEEFIATYADQEVNRCKLLEA